MLTIEKGIPIPSTKERKGENVELLRSMKPGESVFFDAPIVKKATRFYRVAKKLNVNVIIRREGSGMRLWLVGGKEKDGVTKTVEVKKVRLGDTKKNVVVTQITKTNKKKTRALGEGKSNRPVSAKVAELDKKKTKAERDRKRRAAKKTQAQKVDTAEKALASFGEVPNG